MTGEARTQCRACGGYGRVDICRGCDGRGRCTWYMAGSSVSHGSIWLGPDSHCVNGVCSACGGSGRLGIGACPFCGGDGKCPRCLGTGRCSACRGIGLIPNPQGTEMCLECGGTGMVEVGALGAVEAGVMCPDCKRPLVKGDPYCNHCGYRVNRCEKCGAIWIIGTLTCRSCGFSPDPVSDRASQSTTK
jgi:hypothetical protein